MITSEPAIWPLILLLPIVFIWFYPVYLVVKDNKASGLTKLFWIFITVFMSWIAFGMYAVTFKEEKT